jgi:filamentous hemagglutinin family protein
VPLPMTYLRKRGVNLLALAWAFPALPLAANPAGGQVASGSASINTVPGTVTIRQATNQAIINWQTFSIGSGELTKFIQPSATSAVLNRVLGAQSSLINGTLSANGQVYLINGNGILVGPNGRVNTAAFIGSTRDIADSDFLAGNLHFTGSNAAGIQNLGHIQAIGGDVILIGKTVDNQGTIRASQGHVGLAAADDVLVTQAGLEHVFVRAVSNPASAVGKTGVNNRGKIAAAAAELKAANGNIYALATNNSGLIRATGTAKIDGHIWLVAEGNEGVTKNTGTLSARNRGGQGGTIETSGGRVEISGKVDPGRGGLWFIDPSDIVIDANAAATITAALNGGSTVTEDSSVGTGGSGNISVTAPIDWTGSGTLNLDAAANLTINSGITAPNGTLNIRTGTVGNGSASVFAAVNVGTFDLQSGSWIENSATEPGNVLPAFAAANFTITSGALFQRYNGGDGSAGNPYLIVDVYGLQGIGSNNATESASYLVNAAIDASGTPGWNGGAGFVPIGNFLGTFNGNGLVISGLTINLPTTTNVGLFAQVAAGGVIENCELTNCVINGLNNVGCLVGDNLGLLESDFASGSCTGQMNAGGLCGENDNELLRVHANVTVAGQTNLGGLAGYNHGPGSQILDSYANGNVNGTLNLGGLVGNNEGHLLAAYATGNVTGTQNIGGLDGLDVGGLLDQCYAVGLVDGNHDCGGLVGLNSLASSVQQSYAAGAVVGAGAALNIGGLCGENDGTSSLARCYASGLVSAVNATNLGGLCGVNDAGGAISNLFWDSSRAALAVGNDVVTPLGVTNLHGLTVNANASAYAGFDTSNVPAFVLGAGSSLLTYATGDAIWRIPSGAEFPLLTTLSTQISGIDYSNATHTTPIGGATVTLNSGANNSLASTVTSSAAGSVGSYVFLLPADTVATIFPSLGPTLRVDDNARGSEAVALTVNNPNGVPNLLADLTPVDLWARTVRAITPGLTNTLLSSAGGSFISVPTVNAFGGTNVQVAENFDVGSPALNFTLNGDLTALGNLTFDAPGNVAVGYNHPVTLHAQTSGAVPSPALTLNAVVASPATGRALVLQTDGNFINNAGAAALLTPNGAWAVYSQNPLGSGQALVDNDGGLVAFHLYGTTLAQTPPASLTANENFLVYGFTPTLTLTAEAVGANASGTFTVQYGAPAPPLTSGVTGLLPGDTVTSGSTFNQVLSTPPVEATTYAQFSNVGAYPVTFTTQPASLIGYHLVFQNGNIQVTQNTNPVSLIVTGSQNFADIGAGPHYNFTVTGAVAGDPNFNPVFSTTATQFTNVARNIAGAVIPTNNLITLNPASLSNYANVTAATGAAGYTVNPAPVTVSANGTSVYGTNPGPPILISSAPIYDTNGLGGVVSLGSLGFAVGVPLVNSTTPVGTYSIPIISPTILTAGVLGNYNVLVQVGSFVVTSRPLTITAILASTKTYDGSPNPTMFGSSFYTVSSTNSTSGLVNGDTVTGMMGRNDPTNANVGHYTYNLGTLTETGALNTSKANDYTITFNNPGNLGLTITQRAVTVSTTQNATKVYGNADPVFGNTYFEVTAGSLAAGDTLTGDLARAPGENVNGGAVYAFSQGTLGIGNAGGSAVADYAFTFSNTTPFGLIITPRPLTFSPTSSLSKVYGSADPAFTNYAVTAGSLAGSDSLSGTLGRVAGNTVTGSPYLFNAGTVTPINTITSANEAANYALTFTNPSAFGLTITQKALAIAANSDVIGYNATAFTGGNGVTITGFIPGENPSVLGGTLTYSGSSQGAVNAGTYTITPGGLTDANYAITFTNGTLTINQAALTVTANNQAKAYGDADPTLTYTPSGQLFGADTYNVITGVNLSTTTGAAATAGTHPILATGVTATNYAITDVNGLLTVSKATVPLSVTANTQTKVYGGADPTLTDTITGPLFYGDTTGVVSGVTLSTVTGAAATGGPHPIVVSGGIAANYNVADVNGTLNVTPAPLTANANPATTTYTGQPFSGGNGVTITGFVYGQTAAVLNGTLTYGGNSQGAINAGTYTITPGGLSSPNYAITFGNSTLTIGQAGLTVAANNDTLTYNAMPFSGGNGVTIIGFVNGQNSSSLNGTLTYSGNSQGATNAGTYIITPGGLTDGNYAITFTNGTLAINQAALTVTADNKSKAYGDADPGLTYTPSGQLFGADTYNVITGVNLSTTTGAAATAGTHPILATGGTATNYAITDVNGTLSVARATTPLTINIDNKNKNYGGPDPTLTDTITGPLFYGDTPATAITGLVLSTATGAAATAGTHPIIGTGAMSQNYNFNIVNGVLTVGRATVALSVTANNQTKPYGAPDLTLTYTVTGPLFYGDTASVVSGVNLTTTTGSAATVGSYVINATGGMAANYNLVLANGSLSVTPAPLNIIADTLFKPSNTTYVFTGHEFMLGNPLYYADTLTSVGFTSAGAPASAMDGSYPINVVPNSFAGTGLGNYAIHLTAGRFIVEPAALIAVNFDPENTASAFSTFTAIRYDDSYLLGYDEAGNRDDKLDRLQVPGTATRLLPQNLEGIATGSSRVEQQTGLRDLYQHNSFGTLLP